MSAPSPWLPPPDPGDIVWCRFPELESPGPGPKPRPALVITVSDPPDDTDTPYRVRVIYATSRLRGAPPPPAFDIETATLGFAASGLDRTTRFDFRQAVVLNYDTLYFQARPTRPGQPKATSPVMGKLHDSLLPIVKRAHDAAQR
ncbi:hypothetical protein RM531_08035 [Salinisphaera sp. P385]|uniref:Type II toxin-antitoxin system PemK/MazF family toxin n=1 Tax=Spectribacter acetivorans TaxID=3075603 RepID=A0ABU3B8C2_9GAMM|nr:hypothetical protein [Salinisphaera sp. P385]MDT0618423.1 hypothetical protein [Salinisphaera sp. P385]